LEAHQQAGALHLNLEIKLVSNTYHILNPSTGCADYVERCAFIDDDFDASTWSRAERLPRITLSLGKLFELSQKSLGLFGIAVRQPVEE
jgi:hypothetical protein